MALIQFKINGLFGKKDYNISLEDNKLVLVAENGAGKTTIINMLFCFLSLQWEKLFSYKFDSIEFALGKNKIALKHNELDNVEFAEIGHPVIRDIFKTYPVFAIRENMMEIAERYSIPYRVLRDYVMHYFHNGKPRISASVDKKRERLSNILPFKVLYLPTYRRIEKDLYTILPDLLDKEDRVRRRTRRNYIELENFKEFIEFGMQDVRAQVDNKLEELSSKFNLMLKEELTGTFLSAILNKKYQNVDKTQIKSIKPEVIEQLLEQINDDVLSIDDKTRIINFIGNKNILDNEDDKILTYFIYRLSSVYNYLKDLEKSIVQFVEKCNNYLDNKQLLYDNKNFKVDVFPKIGEEELDLKDSINFEDLSSGEKQIVSLFCQIYLSNKEKYFILIDEPELSLSVKWQKKFLPDLISHDTCFGLIGVTHSPFIFDNELDKYAHGLNEFEVK